MQTSEEQLHELSVLIKTLHALMTVGFKLKRHRYHDLTKNGVCYYFQPPTLSGSPEQLLEQMPSLLASDTHKQLLAREILAKISSDNFPFQHPQTAELKKKISESKKANDLLAQLASLIPCITSDPLPTNKQEVFHYSHDYSKREDANPKLKELATKTISTQEEQLIEEIKACQEGTILQDYLQWNVQNKTQSRNCALVLAKIAHIFLPALNENHKSLIRIPSLSLAYSSLPLNLNELCLVAPDFYKVHAIWQALSPTNNVQTLLDNSHNYAHPLNQKNKATFLDLPSEILLDIFKYLLPNNPENRWLESYQKFSNIRLLCKQALNIYNTSDLWKFQFQRVISDRSGYLYEKPDQALQFNQNSLAKVNFKTLLRNELIAQWAAPYYKTVKKHKDHPYFLLEAAHRYIEKSSLSMKNIKIILNLILQSITVGNLSAWFHLRRLAKECYTNAELGNFFDQHLGEFLRKEYQIASSNHDRILEEIFINCCNALSENLPKPDKDKIQRNLFCNFHLWQQHFVTKNFNKVKNLFVALCLKYDNVCLSEQCLHFLVSNPSGNDNLIKNLTFIELNSYEASRDFSLFKTLSQATDPAHFKLIYSRSSLLLPFCGADIDFPILYKIMALPQDTLGSLITAIKNADAVTKKMIVTFFHQEPLFMKFLPSFRFFVSKPFDIGVFKKFKLWSLKTSKSVYDLYADSFDCIPKISIDDFINLLFDEPMQVYLAKNSILKKTFHDIGYFKTQKIMTSADLPFDLMLFQKCNLETLTFIIKYQLYKHTLLWKSLLDFSGINFPENPGKFIHAYALKLILLSNKRSIFFEKNLELLGKFSYRLLEAILKNTQIETKLQKLSNSEVAILHKLTFDQWKFLAANPILLVCLTTAQISSINSDFIKAASNKSLFKGWADQEITMLLTDAMFEKYFKQPILPRILELASSIKQLIMIIQCSFLEKFIRCPYWDLFCEKWGMDEFLQARNIILNAPFWCHTNNNIRSDRSVYLSSAFLSAGSRRFWQAIVSNSSSITHIVTQLNSDTMLQRLLSARPSTLDTLLSYVSLAQLTTLNDTVFFQEHDILTKFLNLSDEQLKVILSLFSFDDLLRISTTKDEQAVLRFMLTFPNGKYEELSKNEQLTALQQLLNSSNIGLLKLSDCIMDHPPTTQLISALLSTFKKDILTTVSLLNINVTLFFVLGKLSHIDSQVLIDGCTSIEEVSYKLNKLNELSTNHYFTNLFDSKYPELAKLILAKNLSMCNDNQLMNLLLSYPQHPLFKVVTYEQLLRFYQTKITSTKLLLEQLLLPGTADEFNNLAQLHPNICDYILKNPIGVSALMQVAATKTQSRKPASMNALRFFGMKRPADNDDNESSKRPRNDDGSNRPASKQ